VERDRLRSRALYRKAPAGREKERRQRRRVGVAGILIALALALGVAALVWSRPEDGSNGTPTPNGAETVALDALPRPSWPTLGRRQFARGVGER